MQSAHRFPLACLILVILLGGWARVVDLGSREFWIDEFNHHYVAQSIEAGQGLKLPSGEPYRRGAVISYAITFTRQFVEDPELSARLPSATLGIIGLALMACTAWFLAGPWAAVWATLLLAIYPEAVSQSRLARFYTLQMAFGMIALVAGWFATVDRRDARQAPAADLAQRWIWALIALTAFYLAYRVQPTTLSVLIAWGCWVAGLAGSALWRSGPAAVRNSLPVQLSLAGILVLVAMTVSGVLPDLMQTWWGMTSWVASWVDPAENRRSYYITLLMGTVPWVLALLPFIAILAFRKSPKLTVFLLVWFAMPLVIHTFLLDWKGARYFLLPLPALFILAGMAASEVTRLLVAGSQRFMADRSVPHPRLAGVTLVAFASAWAIVSLPAFDEFRRGITRTHKASDWRIAGSILAKSPEARSIPWGGIEPAASLHYWGRVDFGVDPATLDNAVAPAQRHPSLQNPPMTEVEALDYYVGVPILTTPEEIRAAYGHYGAVAIGLRTSREYTYDQRLVETLHREAQELCGKSCPRVRLYLWRFGQEGAAQVTQSTAERSAARPPESGVG